MAEPSALMWRAVQLWIARPEIFTAPRARELCEALLAPDEIRRRDRFRFDKDRHLFQVARALLRTTLSRHAPVPPAAWSFIANEHGRPEIDQPAEQRSLRFNISHTDGLVACIVARGREVGVDVEHRAHRGRLLEIADHFFAPSEVQALRALPPEQQRERFFLLWTLKESYIKARGAGLAIPLAQFAFALEEGIGIEFAPELADDPRRWEFAAFSAGRAHVLAAAVERVPGEEIALVLHEAASPA